MCGIAGIVGDFSEKKLVPEMLDIMTHRGPDAIGFFRSEQVHVGHCRLSINDLSERAKQPFVDEDRNVAVAVNGEIYNYQSLKNQLIEKGYGFKSNSDSEVVLHGYIEYGLDLLPKLNGMFAFSIWDGRKNVLYLVRDRLGIKPLYYAKTGSTFIFASEIKALAQYDHLDLSLNPQSFAEYMAFENYFSNRTLNQHIKLVEPGEIVKIRSKDMAINRDHFWTPVFSGHANQHGCDIYDHYRDVIDASVRRHLISDVPVGFYLSSGFDSSSVVSCASRTMKDNIRTYTGFFGMSGFYDESNEAARIAESFGCSNRRVAIRPQDFIDEFEKVLWHLDEPRVGMGSFSQYMVAKCASEEVKVILTGHGGDEFYAGYPVFKAIYGKHKPLKLLRKSSARELMFNAYFALYPFFRKEAGYFLPNIYSLKAMRKILWPDFFASLNRRADILLELEGLKNKSGNEYERLTLTYLMYYLPALFIVEDKISMAFSIESRTPLCDNEMLDFALSVPFEKKLNGFELKHIPKTAMKNRLPRLIYNLPKRGFPTPLRYWFKNQLKDFVREYILDNFDLIPMFKIKEIEKILLRYQSAKMNTPIDEIAAHKIWVLLNLIVYFRNQKTKYR